MNKSKVPTKHDYQAMFAALEPEEVPSVAETTSELLHQVVFWLPQTARNNIAFRLENDRYQFSFTSTPGHLLWYPRKVAMCAMFQRLTRMPC